MPNRDISNEYSIPVPPWCKECRHFNEFIEQSVAYGLSADDVAILALRKCLRPPQPNQIVDNDGLPLEYWQTQLPNCEPGQVLLLLKAQVGAAKYGVRFDI